MPDRDRDQSVEQWLRQTPVPGAPADDCLDAEILAAWAEGVLDAPQRATAEAHASNCARCQAMLAVMVRTTPAAAASTGSPIRKWLMMLGPPMAAAAAVALWFAVGQSPRTTVIDTLSKQQAKAEVESAPAAALPPQGAVSGEADRKVAPPSSDAALQRRERAEPQTLADARKERSYSAAPTATLAPANSGQREKGSVRSEACGCRHRGGVGPCGGSSSICQRTFATAASGLATARRERAGRRGKPAGSGSGAVVAGASQQANQAQNQAQNQNQAPNQNQVQTTAQGPAAPRQQQALEERVVVADKPAARAAEDSAAASRSGGRGGGAVGFADATASNLRAKTGDFELAAAQSTIRWRIVDGRAVQRSPDAGATWSNQYTAPSGVFLTAGTASSATVCWLVGRAGAIVVSTDGVWQRVTFPDAVDLASVVAPDARTATVTTVDGRRFATADGGRTWTRR